MQIIKAVVGVLRNDKDQLLISKRQKYQFKGGYWELPGGKIKIGESGEQAIVRELGEELGIVVNSLSLRQTMQHTYSDRKIKLNIYNINRYQNAPQGVEGQQIAWVRLQDLYNYPLLPTMRAFINGAVLPNKYWITPATNHQSSTWQAKFEEKITQGIELIQLRSKVPLDTTFIKELNDKCERHNLKLLLNTPDKTFKEPYCAGWHITTNEMLKLKKRPITKGKLLGASTHNLNEALVAQVMGADFVVISPVQTTSTHPNIIPLGWEAAQKVVDKLNIPTYFLGGMRLEDLPKTLQLGAQGIAGVSAF